MKFGLEKEFWFFKKGQLSLAEGSLPFDESGYLLEARGKPDNCIRDAVFNLESEIYKIKELVKEYKGKICDVPYILVPESLRFLAGRKFAKGLIKFENYLGYDNHNVDYAKGYRTAGVHISFSNPIEIKRKGMTQIVLQNFDWVKLFTHLDDCFSKEIEESGRNPGFYEVKFDGRVEYRSLPSNINLKKVISVIQSFKWE